MRFVLALGMSVALLTGLVVARRLPLGELGGWLRTAIGLLLLSFTMAIVVFLPMASYGQAMDIDTEQLHLAQLFIGHYVLIVFLLVWWRLRRDRTSLAGFLHVATSGWSARLVEGAKAGVLGWLLAVTMNLTIGGLLGGSGALAEPEKMIPDVVVWFAHLDVGSKLAIIAMAMTVEEAFFRGFLQPRLGELGTSMLFAIGHFSYGLPFLVVGVFTISLVIGRTFERSRDLVPCIVAHGVFDAIQLFVVLPAAVRAMNLT